MSVLSTTVIALLNKEVAAARARQNAVSGSPKSTMLNDIAKSILPPPNVGAHKRTLGGQAQANAMATAIKAGLDKVKSLAGEVAQAA